MIVVSFTLAYVHVAERKRGTSISTNMGTRDLEARGHGVANAMSIRIPDILLHLGGRTQNYSR